MPTDKKLETLWREADRVIWERYQAAREALAARGQYGEITIRVLVHDGEPRHLESSPLRRDKIG